MELNIHSRTIIKTMALIIMLLAIISILGEIYKFTIGHDRYIVDMFDLDSEFNFPTYYATMSLFFCSIILLLIGVVKKNVKDKFYLHWIILSIFFMILSLDENCRLHEQSITPLRNFFKSSGIFHFAWIIPAMLLLLILFFSYLKFIRNLPTKTRILFLFSGSIFVTGAIGGELVSGYYLSLSHQVDDFAYKLIANFEEIFEMIGILSFVYALLDYISLHLTDLRIRILH